MSMPSLPRPGLRRPDGQQVPPSTQFNLPSVEAKEGSDRAGLAGDDTEYGISSSVIDVAPMATIGPGAREAQRRPLEGPARKSSW